MPNFLTEAKILLVSSKPTHRSGIRKLLCDLGANNQNIDVAPDFVKAMDRLLKERVNLVVTDDDIGDGGTAIDLVDLHVSNNPKSKTRNFILMAGDVKPQFRSEFLMRGGDLIIDKPFTNDSFTKSFTNLLLQKGNLTYDDLAALDIEDALEEKNRAEAEKILHTIKNPNSSSGLYSQGLIYDFDQEYLEAYANYAKAVGKKADLKSLVSVVSAGSKVKKYGELGGMVETWIRNFPLYTKSVPDITRVLVYNMKFDLLDEMKVGGKFGSIPIAAGFVVAAGFHLKNGDKKKAVDFAVKGIYRSYFKPAILLRGFEILIEAGAKKEAESLFKELATELKDDQTTLEKIERMIR